MRKKVVIIGSGIGGLATAAILGKKGYSVEVIEKNKSLGGRCNILKKKGFTFDMGPSWYLMPDVFEHFYKLLDEEVKDHLKLLKLSPSYRIFFSNKNAPIDIYSQLEKNRKTFESFEKGSMEKIKNYLSTAEMQYKIAIESFMYKNYNTVLDFFTFDLMTKGSKLSVLETMNSYVSKRFDSDEMRKILMYQLVFLGASPYNTPALYNIMSHIDFNMGVFYPMGGMYEIVKSLVNIGKKWGVTYHTSMPVSKIIIEDKIATGVKTKKGTISADIVISNADIHHTEISLLPLEYQTYKKNYWEKKTMAPSTFLLYLGLNTKVKNLKHHNLYFSSDWKKNFSEIFDHPQLPSDPSIYVCCPSISDATVAPKGKENLFVLVPIAPGLKMTQIQIQKYKDKIYAFLEEKMGIKDIKNLIEVEEFFSVENFETEYNSYKGSALGLAHTLNQTAIFRPNNKSKKVKNLFYVGGNTNPGIGVPICLISAELVYKRISNINSPHPLKSL